MQISRKKILLVEDDPVTALTYKQALEKYGYTVYTAVSGEKAVSAVDAEAGIDLILMDMDLGAGIDGTEAAAAILSKHDIPVLFLSSHTESEIVEKTEKIRSYGYVIKNSTLTVIDASIKMALRLFDEKINERQKEHTLRESEERYRNIMANLEAGVVLHEADTSIIMWNKRATELLGLSDDQLKGKTAMDPYWQFLYEDFTPVKPEHYPVNLVLAGKKPVQNLILGVRKNATAPLVWGTVSAFPEFDENGAISKILVSFIDITARKNAEIDLQAKNEEYEALNEQLHATVGELQIQNAEIRQAGESLRRHDERYSKMVADIGDVIVIIDENGINRYKSPNVERLFGWTPKELTGKSTWENIHPDDLPAMQEFFGRIMKQRYGSSTVECRYRHKNGNYTWIEITLTNLLHDPSIKGLLGNYHEITARKLVEAEIKALLAEKEILLKEVHHRIKNNLTAIDGLLQMQASSLRDTAAVTALEDAGNRVKSMRLLYEKLYQTTDYSELSLDKYFDPLIDEIVNTFPHAEGVRVVKKIENIVLHANRLQPLGIILNELLTNIMKYAFTGKDDGVITVTASSENNRVTLIIADNGNGMPEDVSFAHSTGFGLVLVSGLTRQLGGKIRIERTQGTSIVLEFER